MTLNPPPQYERLIELMEKEGPYNPGKELLAEVLACMREIELPARHIVVGYNKVDSNIYLVKDGLLRCFYNIEDKEETIGFALPGTLVGSPAAVCFGRPAFISVETCTGSVLMYASKKVFEEVIYSSQELTKWMYNVLLSQLAALEMKQSKLSAKTAIERYKLLMRVRPEIIKYVPQNIIASYLGITPQHLSYLRCKLVK